MKKINENVPYRNKLIEKLSALGLDVIYTRAKSDHLYMEKEDSEIQILDFVGGYGANLLGHFHDNLTKRIDLFFKQQTPVFAQGSVRKEAETLSKLLRKIFGGYTVILTNTGAETVETAIKHASLENGKTRCWAIKNAYHGKSIGTLPFSKLHNQYFNQDDEHIDFLDPSNPVSWETALSKIEDISFAIVEPIQGEAGIFPLPEKFVTWLNAVTEKHNIPIIIDEIQSGLGRTGQLLASDQIGLRKDYICLSKAFGGGIAKIGAVLIKDERFVEDFSILNTSTFADDGLSSAIGICTLKTIVEDNLAAKCAEKGIFLKRELLKFQTEFPTVIKEVRGMGLMIGLEFHLQQKSSSNLLRILSKTEYFGYVIAGHLLHEHQIRMMPTLSNPNTLRIQPSAYVSQYQVGLFLKGLRAVCEIISKADAGRFLGYLVGRKPEPVKDHRSFAQFKHEVPSNENKVAFLGHFIQAKDLSLWDSSFESWSIPELEKLISQTSGFLDPVIFDQVNVQATNGESVHLNFIGMFLDSRTIEKAYRSRNFHWIIDKIQHAAKVAEKADCKILGLGGFTSILTKNGKRIQSEKLKITTGNSLTVGMGIEAIRQASKYKSIVIEDSNVAIIGAGGNIANTYAEILSSQARILTLIPRTLGNKNVIDFKNKLLRHNPTLEIKITDNIEAIKNCEIIISSSNSSHPIIFPEHISDNNKIICDLAVPPDVDDTVGIIHPEVLVIKGGIIRLPNGNDFIIGGIPLPRGHVFACMGETLVMGLDQQKSFPGSIGMICPKGTEQTLQLAEKYGFKLGALKMKSSF